MQTTFWLIRLPRRKEAPLFLELSETMLEPQWFTVDFKLAHWFAAEADARTFITKHDAALRHRLVVQGYDADTKLDVIPLTCNY